MCLVITKFYNVKDISLGVCGGLRERHFFNSGRLPDDDDDLCVQQNFQAY